MEIRLKTLERERSVGIGNAHKTDDWRVKLVI